MVTPYRVPFFKALAVDPKVRSLRVLVCVKREVDRQWQVDEEACYSVSVLSGFTLNLRRGTDAMRFFHFRIGIFWELLCHRPDTLVIGDASWTSFLAALACQIYGVRYVVWSEVTTSSQVSMGLAARMRRWMYRGAHQLMASCGIARDFLLQNGVPSKKIHIVLNAVDNNYFLHQRKLWESQRDALRAELGIAPDAFCFIYVGQLISRKRVVETVELLAKVGQEQPVHLLIAGTGPLEEAMRSTATRHGFQAITFCGYAEPSRLSQLYVTSDALILLSVDEPWGMVVNEALLFGKPYFTTDSVAAGKELSWYAPRHMSISFHDVDRSTLSAFVRCNKTDAREAKTLTVSATSMACAVIQIIK